MFKLVEGLGLDDFRGAYAAGESGEPHLGTLFMTRGYLHVLDTACCLQWLRAERTQPVSVRPWGPEQGMEVLGWIGE